MHSFLPACVRPMMDCACNVDQTMNKFLLSCLLLPYLLFSPFTTAALPQTLEEMFIAVNLGDADSVEGRLRQGVDPDVQDAQGNSALMLAAREGHVKVAAVLLDHGAKVYKRNQYGETALMLAAYHGHNPVIDLLIAQGAALGANSKGWNPLIYAAYAGHVDTVRLLLSYGVQVDGQTDAGLTALMLASKRGCIDCVSLLLRMGADANLRSKQGQIAQDIALSAGNTEIGNLLEQAAKIKRKRSD